MNPLLELAKKYQLFVIEDAAEAHGAEYKKIQTVDDRKSRLERIQLQSSNLKNQSSIFYPQSSRRIGSIGHLGCFSFYGNKIITTGEGGMVTTNDKKLANKVRSLGNLARSPDQHFRHTNIGFAYRMSNLQRSFRLFLSLDIRKVKFIVIFMHHICPLQFWLR